MRITARNQLAGTVTDVTHGAVTTTVKVHLAGDNTITSSITREAAEELGLTEGATVTVVIKASDVLLAADDA
jgi:molybdate transport system regulatory protein